MSATATVELLDQRYGVWCDTCLLPSARTATFAARLGQRLTIGSRTICRGCGVKS